MSLLPTSSSKYPGGTGGHFAFRYKVGGPNREVDVTESQSQLLRAQESVLRTLSMTLRAPAPFCRSAKRGATFIVGELISYVVDFSGDPGSSYLDRVRAGCPVRAACTKENAHSAEQTASRA